MKYALSFLCSLLISVLGFSQDSTLTPDLSSKSQKLKAKRDQIMLEFTNDSWLEMPEGVENRGYSPGFSFYSFFEKPLIKKNLGLAFGYGFSSHNVHHNAYFGQDTSKTDDFLTLIPVDDSISYKKNKISSNFIDLRLELRVRTNGDRPFAFAVGGKAGVLVNVHTKFKDDDGTYKTKGLDEAQLFRYGLTGRISYGKIGVNAWYSLSSFLKDNKGIELAPFSVGLSLSIP